MPNINKLHLCGHLTKDVDLRHTQNNTAVANFALAVNRNYKDQSGNKQQETTFIDCEAWGRTAEVLSEYVGKGDPLYIEGRLKLDQWKDSDGNNRQRHKAVVQAFEFMPKAGGSNQQRSGSQQPANGDEIPF